MSVPQPDVNGQPSDVDAVRAETIFTEYFKARKHTGRPQLSETKRRDLLQSPSIQLHVRLQNVRKLGTESPKYEITVDEQCVILPGAKALRSLTAVQDVFMEATDQYVRCAKKDWPDYAQLLLDLAEAVDVGPEASLRGILRSSLVRYLNQATIAHAWEDIRVDYEDRSYRKDERLDSYHLRIECVLVHRTKRVCVRRHDLARWITQHVPVLEIPL